MADVIANRLLAALGGRQIGSSESSLAEEKVEPTSSIAIAKLDDWSNELECQLVTMGGIPKFTTGQPEEEDSVVTSLILKEAADKLHQSILFEITPSIMDVSAGGIIDWEDDDVAANDATLQAANTLSNDNHNDGEDGGRNQQLNVSNLASLLRATGLFMRWDAQVLQQQLASSSNDLKMKNQMIMKQLKSKSMMLLYAKLLGMELQHSSLSTVDALSNHPAEEAISSYPDVQRLASICIFRATYGEDIMTIKARRTFVNTLDGCVYLMKALLKGNQPVPRLFSVMRNVHHLIASFPESVLKMEEALVELNEGIDIDIDNADNGGGTQNNVGLPEILVATLAWTFRSEPPFPGNRVSDRRSELALEILRALYALNTCSARRQPSPETMTQIGIVLCDLLHLSNSDERCYEIKLSVVALLLDAPKDYAGYLIETQSIKALVDIMSYQTSLVVLERTGSSSDDAAAVVPILLVLLKLTQSNNTALQMIKEEVFPPESEVTFEEKATAEIAKGVTEGKANAKNMAPLDAPRGTLRWKLIRLMTWTESNVKRSACELLWMLCEEDSTQFVLRTGFGNAIHFLGIRGHVDLPAGVDI